MKKVIMMLLVLCCVIGALACKESEEEIDGTTGATEQYKARFVQSMLPEDVTSENGHINGIISLCRVSEYHRRRCLY